MGVARLYAGFKGVFEAHAAGNDTSSIITRNVLFVWISFAGTTEAHNLAAGGQNACE